MSQVRLARLESVFHAARELPPTERLAYLDRICGDDDNLRREVESLLAEPGDDGLVSGGALRAVGGADAGVHATVHTGQALGVYRLGPVIGVGGMGAVYRARDTKLQRDVAVKILPRAFADDPARLARFDREARVLATLNHPHIAQIYGVEDAPRKDGDGPLRGLILELVDGETLAERLRRGRPPLSETLRIAIEIASALEAAHDRGIIHRDLKPANIKLTSGGATKVLDFGLAKRSAADERDTALATGDGAVLGTPAYMSPEQARGEATDRRTDVWAFGCVLFELLTGQRAFAGATASDAMVAVLTRDPDWAALPHDTPIQVTALLERCLEKDARRRQRDVGDARLELEHVSARLGRHSRQDGPLSVGPRRSRIAAPLQVAGTTVLALFALVAGAGWYRATTAASHTTPVSPDWRRLTYRQGYVHNARYTPDGQTIVYSAAWDGRPIELYAMQVNSADSRALDLPAAGVLGVSSSGELAVGLGCLFEVSNGACTGATLARVAMMGTAPRRLAEGIKAADWNGADLLAVVRATGIGQNVVEFPLGTQVTLSSDGHVRLAPDGKGLAWTERESATSLKRVMVSDALGTRAMSSGWAFISGLAWSMRGNALFVSGKRPGQDGQDHVSRVQLDGSEQVVLRGGDRLRVLDVSADGRLLIDKSRTSQRLSVRELGPSADAGRDLTWQQGSVADALSRDGRTVLFTERGGGAGAGRYRLFVRPADGGPPTRLDGFGYGLALSEDGRWVLSRTRPERGAPELVVHPLGTGTPRRLDRGTFDVDKEQSPADFVGTDQVIFRCRRASEPWRTCVQSISQGPPHLIDDAPGTIDSPMAPDGNRFISVREDGSRWVVSLSGATPVRFAASIDPMDRLLEWTSDGRGVYLARRGIEGASISRVDVDTGRSVPFARIPPSVSTSFYGYFGRGVFITPDGRTLVTTETFVEGDLFEVTGLP